MFFIFICLFYACSIGYTCINLLNKINSTRLDHTRSEEILKKYEKKTVAEPYKPFITSTNNAMLTADCQSFLGLLSKTTTENIKIDSISISIPDKILIGQLKDQIKSESITSIEANYQKFIDSIGNMQGLKIKKHYLKEKKLNYS
ncbi:MAG: hypothetical protein N3A59_07055 [Thermodesulfovibrionales bacterium]|nr:hypothetical protein [Thermodesulfovibrionales bacterium]